MNKSIEQMIGDVVRRYGFEVKQTLDFCFLCEKGNMDKIIKRYEKLMR